MKRTLLTLFLVMAACFLVITSCDDSKNIKVYTVSFDTDDGTEVPVQSVREGGKAEKPADPEKAGYTFKEWQLDNTPYNFDEAVTSDITLKAVWTKLFTVSFDLDEGVGDIKEQTVTDGGKLEAVVNPTKDGFVFSGWVNKADGSTFNIETDVISADITLKALWKGLFTVTFDLNEGTGDIEDQTVIDGGKLEAVADPTRTKFVFSGWVNKADDKPFDIATDTVSSDITLKAVWKELFTFTFSTGEGSSVNPQEVIDGETAVQPSSVPTREGYQFVRWAAAENGTTDFDFNTPINENTTIYAVWKQVYTVTFIFNNTTVYSTIYVEPGKTAARPENNPTAQGFKFVRWSAAKDGTADFDFNTPINENTTIYAVWEPVYTVVFNSNGGSTVNSQTVDKGAKITKPADPTKGGCTFVCWLKNGSEFKFDTTPINENTTLIAKWSYTTSYSIGGKGPAGGIIFYDAGIEQKVNYEDSQGNYVVYTWRYLEAAPKDSSDSKAWGPTSHADPQETEVGSGRANTDTLLKTSNRYYAAGACADYGDGTAYDDWFLPSLEELELMYKNLKEKGLGGTWGSESYWSSSGSGNVSAWSVNFSDGDQISAARTNYKGVRPIRAF